VTTGANRTQNDRDQGPAAPDTTATAQTPLGVATPKSRNLTDRDKAERRLGVRLVLPAAIVMALVTIYPICYAIWLSLQRYNLRFPDDRKYVWFANYGKILSSGVFWQVFWVTILITVISVAIEFVLGLALALVMHRAIFGRNIVRTSILIPYGIITVVAAFAFRFAVSPDDGGFLFKDSANPPLSNHWGSLAVIILTEVWKTTPFMSLLLLAGLATVPNELVEAAKVDGATAWQRLRKVILPTMKAAVMVALLFRTLDAIRIFDTVYIQTKGANNTATLSQLGYNQLINQLNLGLGSAVSVLLFLLVVLIAFIFVKGFRTDLGQVRGER
jgi:multiple sugar transport system permease protein